MLCPHSVSSEKLHISVSKYCTSARKQDKLYFPFFSALFSLGVICTQRPVNTTPFGLSQTKQTRCSYTPCLISLVSFSKKSFSWVIEPRRMKIVEIKKGMMRARARTRTNLGARTRKRMKTRTKTGLRRGHPVSHCHVCAKTADGLRGVRTSTCLLMYSTTILILSALSHATGSHTDWVSDDWWGNQCWDHIAATIQAAWGQPRLVCGLAHRQGWLVGPQVSPVSYSY